MAPEDNIMPGFAIQFDPFRQSFIFIATLYFHHVESERLERGKAVTPHVGHLVFLQARSTHAHQHYKNKSHLQK
jgi:hypothetical protein